MTPREGPGQRGLLSGGRRGRSSTVPQGASEMARNVCPEPAETPARQRRFSIREILPPYDPGVWPQGFTVSREQIYDDMGRLTGGPEDSSGDGGPTRTTAPPEPE